MKRIQIILSLALLCVSCSSGGESSDTELWFEGADEGKVATVTEELQTVSNVTVLKVPNPNIVTARGNTVYKMEDSQNSTDSQILYRSTDGGTSFSALSTPTSRAITLQALHVTPNDTLLWAYATNSGETEDLVKILRSTDQGNNFSPMTLAGPGECYHGSAIVVSKEKRAIGRGNGLMKGSVENDYYGTSGLCGLNGISWVRGASDAPLYLLLGFEYPGGLQFYKSDDDGISFSEIDQITDAEVVNDVTFGSSGQSLYLLSGIFGLLKSTDAGANFIEKANETIQDGIDMKSAVEGENLYVAFVQLEERRYDWFFIKSSDAGETFTDARRIARIPDDQFSEWRLDDIEVIGNDVYILWSKHKIHDTDPDGAVYLAHSTDGGESFAVPARISDYTDSTGDLWSSAIKDQAGKLFVFWTDGSLDSLR